MFILLQSIWVNMACIEGMSQFDFSEVAVSEGRSYPSDSKVNDAVVIRCRGMDAL